MKALITTKIGMTSIIDEAGAMRAVTLLSADNNRVTEIKNTERDGYMSIQIGAGKAKKARKPQVGQAKKSKSDPAKTLKEIKISEMPEGISLGDSLEVSTFEAGDKVDVTGTSKGKGFAGGIKRHNFKRGRKTHGGRSYRRPGSIGSMYPQKVFKGKRMAGQLGNETVTTKRLTVAFTDPELSLIAVYGAVPGPKKANVLIKEAE